MKELTVPSIYVVVTLISIATVLFSNFSAGFMKNLFKKSIQIQEEKGKYDTKTKFILLKLETQARIPSYAILYFLVFRKDMGQRLIQDPVKIL